MRILLANKFLHPRGGAERAVLDLGAALQARGHRVAWFGMQHPQNAVSGADVALVRRREYRGSGTQPLRDGAAMLYSFEARRKFATLLQRSQAQVVHVHNIYHQLTPSILDAAAAAGVPVVMTVHDYKLVCPRYDLLRHGVPCDACMHEGFLACLRFRCGGSWAASAWLAAEALLHQARRSYAVVQRFLVPSRFMQAMLQRGGIEAERLQYLPNFAPAVSAGPETPVPQRFVYAGRLSPEKGLRTLVRAASRLPAGSLVLCGSGPLEPELRELAAAAPPGRVVFCGQLSAAALWQEMRAASFVVLPSECLENAPFAVLEAMALGRAVLASQVGGVPELVRPGETGELLPPGDVEAWRRGLEVAIAQPERWRQLGLGARRAVEHRHGLTQHVEAVERIYTEVCG